MSSKTSQQPFSPKKTNQNDSKSIITKLSLRVILKGKREEREEKMRNKTAANTRDSRAQNRPHLHCKSMRNSPIQKL
jgi:hypothetical protein